MKCIYYIDKSSNYRIGISLETLKRTLKDYALVGCGFGNINMYPDLEIMHRIGNAFISFWIETGIFSIIYIVIILGILFRNCLKSKFSLK